MNILVLGANGMIGNAIYRYLRKNPDFAVSGTVRNSSVLKHFSVDSRSSIITGIDIFHNDVLTDVLAITKPDIVINCIGLINKYVQSKDPLYALPLNSVFPHRLARLCGLANIRLIHISTDCVFSGSKGGYLESDVTDAQDMYGKSKALGELRDYPHAFTIRTSTIGRELESSNELLGWFLAQKGVVKGYANAIFSGLTTNELARVISDYVIPNKTLNGLYHVSSEPINKFELLTLLANVYNKDIKIIPDFSLSVDKSLDSSRFRTETGYCPPSWSEMIERLYSYENEMSEKHV